VTIQIKSIHVNKLGPINSLDIDLGMLNLIYGPNEIGKTFLAEFLLQSIFRHANKWELRALSGQGSVNIQGLQQDLVPFSPSSNKKIEDYWQDEDLGLPLNMARLLVVKGGELALSTNTPGGVNRAFLKTALTSQALIDQIWDEIPATVRKAKIVNQCVQGNNQGQIKEQNQLQDELNDLNDLLDEIEENYSRGPARQLELECAIIRSALTDLQIAKRHKAYRLWENIQALITQKETIADEFLTLLRDNLRDYDKLSSALKDLQKEFSQNQEVSLLYQWLESAIDVWTDKSLDKKGVPDKVIGLFGAVILAAGLITLIVQSFLNINDLIWPGTVASIIGLGLSVYYGLKLQQWSKSIDDSNERISIRSEFNEKFGLKLRSLTGLKEQKNIIQEQYLRGINTKDQILQTRNQLNSEAHKIDAQFTEILGAKIKKSQWTKKYQSLKDQSLKLTEEINNISIQLSKLNINQDDFLTNPAQVDFDPLAIEKYEGLLQDLEDKLVAHHNNLETLKARACERTRDDMTTPWHEVLYHLRNMANDVNNAYKTLTAELVAKIGLTEILTTIQLEEDQKIKRDLNSEEVSDLLKKLTGKYQSLDLMDDQIYARDQYSQYALGDLSTGAREQIQLTLRLGIASRVSGGNPLFLILDDAFQHSDWKRRESLIKGTIDLANNGWQVIYLSMDDHIRDLFQKLARPILKKKYKYFELK